MDQLKEMKPGPVKGKLRPVEEKDVTLARSNKSGINISNLMNANI